MTTTHAWPPGVRPLLSAQFMSALADNAALILAIAVLHAQLAPAWAPPFLKFFFMTPFVLLAFVVGALADRWPKARVMMVTNAVKALGCASMAMGADPLLAYGLIGLGAAAYSPAKYGLLLELLPARRLVVANAWLEGLTLASVVLGTVAGGGLASPEFAQAVSGIAFSSSAPDTPLPALHAGLWCLLGLYLLAALLNTRIPVKPSCQHALRPQQWLDNFRAALTTLARDHQGGASLAVTTLMWGLSAVLQFVVLDWARENLGLALDRASMLQGVVAIGVALGAVLAARMISLDQALRVLPLGGVLGILVVAMLAIDTVPWAAALMLLVGSVAGFLIVPMNALLQHRGYVLMQSGQSIAVQNFCENLSVMLMMAAYATARQAGASTAAVSIGVSFIMVLVMLGLHRRIRRTPLASAATTTPPSGKPSN